MQRAEQMRTAPDGDILVAEKGSAFPDEIADAFDFGAEWDVLGLTDDNGVELTPDKKTGEIPVWQQATPGKYFVQGASFGVGFTLVQFSVPVFKYYWGTEWTLTAGGSAKMVFSSNPPLDEMMLAVRWRGDNDSTNLIVVERGMVTSRQAMKINRNNGTMSGTTFNAMDHEGHLAILLTDDPEVLAELNASS